MATTKLWTVEDAERLPDDDFRYALIRGALYRMPPPKARHGRTVSTVGWHLHGFVWVIDPVRRTVRVHRVDGSSLLLTEHDVLDGEDILPGFQVSIARLFA
jgi:Uma2 family endonuclease